MPKSFPDRVRYAASALDRFGRWGEEPYSRPFDACFEQYDGAAVVSELVGMRDPEKYYEYFPTARQFSAIDPDPGEYIARAISRMGANCLAEWEKTARELKEKHSDAPMRAVAAILRKNKGECVA